MSRVERLLAGHPSIQQTTSAPAPGYDQIERSASEDVPPELVLEREIAAEAARLTAERNPNALPGTVDPGIADRIRRRLKRLQAEDARHLARELEG